MLALKEQRFVGFMKTVLGDRGFGWIGSEGVRQNDGSPFFSTKEDIYVHIRDCGDALRAGETYEFALIPDDTRGEGTYRAVAVRHIPQNQQLQPTKNASVALAKVMGGMRPMRLAYHEKHGARAIAPELTELVVRNEPFRELLVPTQKVHTRCRGRDHVSALGSEYLRAKFPHIVVNCGIPNNIALFDSRTEEGSRAVMAKIVNDHRELGADQQADFLEAELERYLLAVKLLQWVVESDIIQEGQPIGPETIAGIIALIETDVPEAPENVIARANETRQVLGFLASSGLLNPYSVLPMKYLPEIFMACPVFFFVHPNNKAALDDWKKPDPRVSPAVAYLCNRFPNNQRWADLVQLFNRRERPMALYTRGEAIPPAILDTIRTAKAFFDCIIIATPYHDIAGREWGDLAWVRSLDPYVLGFKNELPCFFVLGRYSDGGIFPLFHELVAETMEFLREHRVKIRNFNDVANPYWLSVVTQSQNRFYDGGAGDDLTQLTIELERAYNQGILFDWIRQEKELAPVENMLLEATSRP